MWVKVCDSGQKNIIPKPKLLKNSFFLCSALFSECMWQFPSVFVMLGRMDSSRWQNEATWISFNFEKYWEIFENSRPFLLILAINSY